MDDLYTRFKEKLPSCLPLDGIVFKCIFSLIKEELESRDKQIEAIKRDFNEYVKLN